MVQGVIAVSDTSKEGLERVCRQLRDSGSKGVFALFAEAAVGQVPILQAAARAHHLQLSGGVFPALIHEARFGATPLLLYPLPEPLPYRLIPLADYDEQPRAGIAEIVDLVEGGDDGTPSTLVMLFDSQFGKVASFLDRLYLELGDSVSYAGACAGSETFQPMPCLFDADRLLGQAVLVLRMPEDMPVGIEHGYAHSPEGLVATSTSGNCIDQINWHPALSAYADLARRHYGLEVTADNFYEMAVHFPFGISRLHGESVVRIPVALTDKGAIHCVGEIPENAVLTLLKGPDAPDAAVMSQVARPLVGHCRRVLVFYCAGRRMHMGASASGELALLAAELPPDLPWGGALSLGEIGVSGSHGYPLFHNACVMALGGD